MSLSTANPAVVLDPTAYPHVFDTIQEFSGVRTLLALRCTSRHVKSLVDPILQRERKHIVILASSIVYRDGTMARGLSGAQLRVVDFRGPQSTRYPTLEADQELWGRQARLPRTTCTCGRHWIVYSADTVRQDMVPVCSKCADVAGDRLVVFADLSWGCTPTPHLYAAHDQKTMVYTLLVDMTMHPNDVPPFKYPWKYNGREISMVRLPKTVNNVVYHIVHHTPPGPTRAIYMDSGVIPYRDPRIGWLLDNTAHFIAKHIHLRPAKVEFTFVDVEKWNTAWITVPSDSESSGWDMRQRIVHAIAHAGITNHEWSHETAIHRVNASVFFLSTAAYIAREGLEQYVLETGWNVS